MLSNEDLLEQAQKHIQQHLSTQDWWRTHEVKESLYVYEGMSQWTNDDLTKYEKDGIPTITINKIAPIIDAVTGFEVQNRSEVKYQPRRMEPQQDGVVNVVDNTVKYIQQDSFASFEKSQAFRDMLITGVGCTSTTIEYLENPDGETEVERISPYFVGWDVAARRKNLIDANHVWAAKVTTEEEIIARIEEKTDKSASDIGDAAVGLCDDRFMDFIDVAQTDVNLGIIYEYQWREKETFWRLKNIFKDMQADGNTPDGKMLMAYVQSVAEEHGFDIGDPVFSIKKGKMAEFKAELEAMGLEWKAFKPTKQQVWKYYRAEIAGSTVLEKSELFSQKGFSIKFMTGKFSESKQCWYGLLRAAKEAQRAYNRAISDLQGYLNTIPKGGVNIEEDAVADLKAFIDTYSKARNVTVFKSGALAGGKVVSKAAPPLPPGLTEMVAEMSNSILEVMGVTREFMGIMDTKEMTATLNRQMVRQGLMVLASYFDALKYYTIEQGKLFIDCVRIMAENAPGRLVRNVVGVGSEPYVKLTANDVAAEYDIIVKDVPQSADEKNEIFMTLMELGRALAGNGVDIMPLAIQFAPLEKEERDKVIEMMKPPPPPPPDPNAIALVQAEVDSKKADAEKARADADKANADATYKKIETLEKQINLKHGDEKAQAEILKMISEVRVNNAKAGETRNKEPND